MNCRKVGELIFSLRKEKNMTQKEVADAMNISDKTVSKWERGLGCPDVSLLNQLSLILGVNIEKILLGDLNPNDVDGGNMKHIKFYVCPNCSNVINSTGEGEISCCGRKLEALIAKPEDDKHKICVDEIELDYYITMAHEMSKAHYISLLPVNTAFSTTPENWLDFVEQPEISTLGVYEIYTAEQLAWIAKKANEGHDFHGEEILLCADIDLDGKEWIPMLWRQDRFQEKYYNAVLSVLFPDVMWVVY